MREIPRSWVGTYQAFGGSEVVPAALSLSEVRAVGQIVDLRGTMTINGASTQVQGNLNAESDQLDLILLCRCNVGGLEMGGMFSGQQGLTLAGWNAPRLTNAGGRLEMQPQSSPPKPRVQPEWARSRPVVILAALRPPFLGAFQPVQTFEGCAVAAVQFEHLLISGASLFGVLHLFQGIGEVVEATG